MNRILLVVLLFGCSKSISTKDQHDRLVEDIRTRVSARGFKTVEATCPTDKQIVEKGAKFTCTGTADGKPFSVAVTVGDQGAATWDVVGKMLKGQELADTVGKSASAKLKVTAAVTCAEPMYVINPGDHFICDLVIGDRKGHIKVTGTADGKDVDWEVIE